MYVEDVAAANVFLARQPGLCGVYNVANGQTITITQLAEQIVEMTGSGSPLRYAPERPGDIKHSRAAIDKIRSSGFVPSNTFQEGLKETIEFFHHEGQESVR